PAAAACLADPGRVHPAGPAAGGAGGVAQVPAAAAACRTAGAAAVQPAVLRPLRRIAARALPCRDRHGDAFGRFGVRNHGPRYLCAGLVPGPPQVPLPAPVLPVLPRRFPAGLRRAGLAPGGGLMSTVADLIRDGAARLPGQEARLEAELLLAHALEKPRSWFYAHAGDVMGPREIEAYQRLLRRRADGEPVAQITGRRGFWSLDLVVTPDVLIPRPETELLVELALERLERTRPATVLDLGTGTGAIALAIAAERPLAEVTAVD